VSRAQRGNDGAGFGDNGNRNSLGSKRSVGGDLRGDLDDRGEIKLGLDQRQTRKEWEGGSWETHRDCSERKRWTDEVQNREKEV